MKSDIHPTYHQNVNVTCSCGNTFQTGSTSESLSVEICSNCHPYYTGKSKVVDTQGRVERFKRMMEKKSSEPKKVKTTKVAASKVKKESKKSKDKK